jgi:predicted transposase YdaD
VHDYDTVLKSLLTDSENSIFAQITGVRRGRWLNVELPNVTQTRVDLLFETADVPPRLIAMELQSTNDMLLPLRMAEYSLRVFRLHKQFPEQYVLYVGSDPLNMPSALMGANHTCRYEIVDIRNWDAETLANSPFPADSVLAILARSSERRETIRRILERVAKLGKGPALDAAFSKLMILAGIRKLGDVVQQEAKTMPILNDIMDHDVIGPAIRQGIEQGLQQGLQQGLKQGLAEGLAQGRSEVLRAKEEARHQEALAIVRRLINARFGSLSSAHEEQLGKLSLPELEDLGVRLFAAASMTDLFA